MSLSEGERVVLIGLIVFSDRQGTIKFDVSRLRPHLAPEFSPRRFQALVEQLTELDLIGPVGSTARYVRLDPDFEYAVKRLPVPRYLREAVIVRDGMRCGLCGLDIPQGDLHIDHIYPVSLGGTDDLDNLQPAHSRCNLHKGARV